MPATGSHLPVIVALRGADPWIPVALSVKGLDEIAKTRHDIETRIVAGASHEMVLGAHETMAFDEKTMLVTAPQRARLFRSAGKLAGAPRQIVRISRPSGSAR
jgi:hypothetical protein